MIAAGGAYYNEIDEFAAQWLRNLIGARLIAPGEVDTRSIEDVHPDDLRGFTQCHFFAGIGVWSHALRRAGIPDDRQVWTGSCPCQPFSAAGKRGGTADERHLWPAFFHLIETLRPAIVLGEQVASKDGLAWLDLVSADMEGAGYAFGANDLCAAGVGAPHIRQRLWFVGIEGVHNTPSARQLASGIGAEGEASAQPGEIERPQRLCDARRLDDDDDARSQGHARHDGAALGRQEPGRSAAEASVSCGLADGDGGDARAEGLQRSGEQRQQPQDGGSVRGADDQRQRVRPCGSGEVGAAQSGLQGADRERQRFRPDAGAVDDDVPARAGPTNGVWRDADWLLCRDGRWRPVEPGTFPLVNGAPGRVGRLRAYGNAIVAEAAREFIEAVDWSLAGDMV